MVKFKYFERDFLENKTCTSTLYTMLCRDDYPCEQTIYYINHLASLLVDEKKNDKI